MIRYALQLVFAVFVAVHGLALCHVPSFGAGAWVVPGPHGCSTVGVTSSAASAECSDTELGESGGCGLDCSASCENHGVPQAGSSGGGAPLPIPVPVATLPPPPQQTRLRPDGGRCLRCVSAPDVGRGLPLLH